MKKTKRISTKNLHLQLSMSTLVNFWFLYEHFSQEWVRTILIVGLSLNIVAVLYSAFNSESVDIFKKDSE